MKRFAKFKNLSGIIFSIFTLYMILIYAVALAPQEKLLGKRCLPDKLKERLHDDYYLPDTTWIPFYATSWCLVEPPILLIGNQKSKSQLKNGQEGPKPIPMPGEWQISIVQIKKKLPLILPYAAFTTKSNLHFRIGCRWDDIDHYYVFPSISVKRLSNKNPR